MLSSIDRLLSVTRAGTLAMGYHFRLTFSPLPLDLDLREDTACKSSWITQKYDNFKSCFSSLYRGGVAKNQTKTNLSAFRCNITASTHQVRSLAS